MKKGLIKLEKMGDYEKQQGYASYRTIVEYYIGDIVLCNNIVEIDDIWSNMINGYDEETEEYVDIFQYYLCNISEWNRKELEEMGIILSYSDKLDCDVLCVDHYGTSWDYVLTDVKLFDTYEELEKYESEEE